MVWKNELTLVREFLPLTYGRYPWFLDSHRLTLSLNSHSFLLLWTTLINYGKQAHRCKLASMAGGTQEHHFRTAHEDRILDTCIFIFVHQMWIGPRSLTWGEATEFQRPFINMSVLQTRRRNGWLFLWHSSFEQMLWVQNGDRLPFIFSHSSDFPSRMQMCTY